MPPSFSTVKLLCTALQSVFCGERYFELCKYPFTFKNNFQFIHLFFYICQDLRFPILFNELYSVIIYFDA